MTRVSGALRAARGSSIARNTSWLLAGELFGLASQLVMFILVTNTFDSDVYGMFVGVVSLALFIGPFSSFGAGYLVVQRVVARGEALRARNLAGMDNGDGWGTSLGGTLIALHGVVLPQATMILLVEVIIAELFFNQLVQANRFIGQAIDKLWLTPVMTASSGITRVVFAVWYLRIRPNPTIEGWGVFYFLSVAFGAVVGMTIIWVMVGDQIRAHFPHGRDLGEGLTFSINTSSAMLKGDADKFLLTRMNQEAANGVYSAGYRILGLAIVPNTALGDATYARSSRHRVPEKRYALAKRLSMVSLVLNTISGIVVFFGASLITGLLGPSYAESADVLRWMCVRAAASARGSSSPAMP